MKLQVLRALDIARIQRYHFMAVLIAGLGFYTDAYDLFAIVSITKLLGRLYYFKPGDTNPGTLPPGVYESVVGMAYIGAMCGQLFFGWAGDRLGRRRVFGMTLALMMISSIMCGLSFGTSPKGVITTLCFFRFWLGFGLGGDYPLSAIIMSESSNTKYRGAFIAMVFAMQGFGILTAATVTLILSSIFKTAYKRPPFWKDHEGSTAREADYLWRIIVVFGALPAALTCYYRMRMPETARYTAIVKGDEDKALADMKAVLEIRHHQSPHQSETRRTSISRSSEDPQNKPFGFFSRDFVKLHGKELVGVCVCWFVTDVVFYSLNIYQKDFFTGVGWLPKPKDMSALEETYKISRAQAFIALVATIPGYWVTVVTVDRIGRRSIQLLGFLMMGFFMALLAFDYTKLSNRSNVALYALASFFANFGPNATSFIIPAELFPARLRTTCNGIAAAAGKAGAIMGVFAIVGSGGGIHGPEFGQPKSKIVLGLIAISSLLGFGFTFLLPETKRVPLEKLSHESSGDYDEGEDTPMSEVILLPGSPAVSETQPPSDEGSGPERPMPVFREILHRVYLVGGIRP